MSRIRLVLSSFTAAAVAGTLAFGISSAAAQPAAPTASGAQCSTNPGPTPFEFCLCPDGTTGYCSSGICRCST